MNRINDLLSELRAVTERSRPNTMANDQLNLIEAIEHELNNVPVEKVTKKTVKVEVETPVTETATPVETETPAAETENPSETETSNETPKRGRKPTKQD